MTAPTCPHCGVKKPYKKTFSDMPKWQQYFVFLTLGPVAVMIAIGYANREDAGLKRVQDLSDDQYKGKYEEYVNLNEISPSTGYKNKATEYGKKYLQTIPVTEASKNLQIYKNLADFDPTSDYEGKIALYSFMVDVSTSCAISAQKMSKGVLNNPSTYDSHALGSGGKWLSQNRYGYVHSFGGANAFGVATNFQAEYVCNTNADTKKYSVQRVSLTKN